MSKKILFSTIFMLLTIGMYAQTIVGITEENRNVVLEEFTGIKCQFCPQGHAIAQAMKDNNPDDVFLVNVHTGGYAVPAAGEPDFRTSFGQALADQSQLAGYPAGTINRENFPGSEQNGSPGGATGQGRGTWSNTGSTLLGNSSYVNMAVEADIDVQTNVMTIHVETYYTGNSPQATNKLNVYILQNNTTGPQTGGNAGNNYVHQHRLVDMPFGQWGADITSTSTGSFDDRTIAYTIPADYNGVAVELADLEVVVSVAEGNQYIVSGNGALPTYSGITASNDVDLRTIEEIPVQCLTELGPKVNIKNLGQDPITSLDITYSINGGASSVYNYTGNITSLQNEDVELPAIAYTSQAVNTVDVTITDDEDNANNALSTTFGAATQGAGNVTLTIDADQYASEISWNIRNSAGSFVESDVLNAGDNNDTLIYNLALEGVDCYTFQIIDSYGDGILGGGGVSLIDINGVEHFPFTGNYGSGAILQFGADGVLGTSDETFEGLSIFPNPAKGFFHIVNAENADVTIFDLRGRKVRNIDKISKNEKVDTIRMSNGTYFVTITKDGFTTTEKLIIK
ncbi:MAG: hypothetical protein ACI825_000366 [Planctomycetota bacterium]|jgi:hypothetical protein